MDDLGQMLALCQEVAQGLAILGVEELVREDESETAFLFRSSSPFSTKVT